MKMLVLMASLMTAANTYALDSREFINCFEKAMNERIEEIKAENPDVKICDQLSKKDSDRLFELYTTIEDRKIYYYSAEAMGQENVRFHYERLMYEIECYKAPGNILTAWVKGFGNAVGVYKHTNFQLVEDTFTKMLGRKMWTENGSDKFSEHKFEYCQ